MRSEKDEEISLCCLPIHSSKVDEMGEYAVPDHDPSTTLRPTDYFEFFTSNKIQSDMCPADDIIVSGKLIPLKDQCASLIFPVIQIDGSPIECRLRKDVCCRHSESSSELKSTSPSSSIKTRLVRNYSWKSDRLSVSSNSSSEPELDRNYSWKSYRSSVGTPKMSKSRWQSLTFGFGMVKYPLEMELRDIKIRQSRRSYPASLFPATPDSEANSPTSGRFQGRGTSWGLIKTLTCKDHRSTFVNTSLVYMPRI